MKKIIAVCLAVITAGALLCGCSSYDNSNENGKLSVVATIFPQYDFSRQIGGDKIDVHLLIPPGGESHTYEPTPEDIIRIKNADIFIYTGGENDTWLDTVLESIDNPELTIIKLLDCVDTLEEETVDGMENHEHSDDAGHEEEPDEHVWTSPVKAAEICRVIEKNMVEKDPANADYYSKNLNNYVKQLSELDAKFRNISENAVRHTLIFGDRFPLRYFAEEYGFEYYAAFPGCSSESEPGAKTIAFLIDKVKAEKIPVVFYIEFSNHLSADTIAEQAGVETVLFHSCHNVTSDEMASGATYISLMENNIKALEKAVM